MEAVRGSSLKERLTRSGALSELEGRTLIRSDVLGALAAWSEAKLIHRDIKPANILLGEIVMRKMCHSMPNSVILDWPNFVNGPWQLEDVLTNTGVAVGTPHYMSPEQATGDRTADQRHDIYGLAATVYHALLGKTLYSGGSSAIIMYKQATASLDIRPLQRRGISAELVDLLSAMLAKPRERRLADWQVVLDSDRPFAASGPQPICDAPNSTVITGFMAQSMSGRGEFPPCFLVRPWPDAIPSRN